MRRFAFLLFTAFLLLSLASCFREAFNDVNTDYTDSSALIDTEALATDTADSITTDAPTTPPVTTAPVTTVPVTTVPVTTAPPVLSNDPVTVTYPISYFGYTYTGLPTLPSTEYTVADPYNSRGLDGERKPFSYGAAKNGAPHAITVNNQARFDSYGTNGLAWDNKSGERVLYLTFDCGYKYGDLTERILDTLLEKEVRAAFFCTMPYLKTEPYEIARMINEGHVVGNHSVNHPDCTTVSRERLASELLGVHNYMRVNFGYTPEYFRFPTGAYSEDSLELVSSVGYKSVFWSVAYADWDPQNQLGEEAAFSQVTSRLHPGAVILLHSTSPDNAAILSRVIDYARAEGYEFRGLDEYPFWAE